VLKAVCFVHLLPRRFVAWRGSAGNVAAESLQGFGVGVVVGPARQPGPSMRVFASPRFLVCCGLFQSMGHSFSFAGAHTLRHSQ